MRQWGNGAVRHWGNEAMGQWGNEAMKLWSDGPRQAATRCRITRLDPSIAVPAYATDGSAGFDLSASVDMAVAPGEVALSRPG